MGNTGPDGSLDTDAMMQGLLQYRNTPLQKIGLSPAQILLHRNLKDALPGLPSNYKLDPFWIEQAELRLKWNHEQTKKALLQQDVARKSKVLTDLVPGTRVRVQNKRKGQHSHWNQTGVIVSSQGNRQYLIQLDSSGRTTLRNRRHIRPMLQGSGSDRMRFLPTALVRAGTIPIGPPAAPTVRENPGLDSAEPPDHIPPPPESQHTAHDNGTGSTLHQNNRVPRALARLLPFNKPGRKENE